MHAARAVLLAILLCPPLLAQQTSEYTRILLPLTGADAGGVNGAIWRTQLAALVTSDTQPDVLPHTFLPLREQFDPRDVHIVDADHGNGAFVYMLRADAAKLHVNSRVYDVSRFGETAGSEIAIVREEQFTASRVSLLGIPVAPQYRHTLRVYELNATPGATVIVRVYAGEETTPRVETTRQLSVSPERVDATFDAPAHPGYLQIDLRQLLALDGLSTLRVDVEPVGGVRLWSFVSVTSNQTHHVTTFSQH
jgi:hypothetical protein